MSQSIYRVVFFEIQAPYTLRVCFDDDTEQVIDFQDTLAGELFGPLRDSATVPCSTKFRLIQKSIRWYGRTGPILTQRPYMTGPSICLN